MLKSACRNDPAELSLQEVTEQGNGGRGGGGGIETLVSRGPQELGQPDQATALW